MDARTRRKINRKNAREAKASGADWFLPMTAPEHRYVPIPGQDFYVETPEAQAKIDRNSWEENFDEVIAFIKQATNEEPYEADGNTLKPGAIDWSWSRNMDCKYINIRIDMRDGGFVLVNQRGERVSLDAIKWQYKSKDE
jgi:hypothetical protein